MNLFYVGLVMGPCKQDFPMHTKWGTRIHELEIRRLKQYVSYPVINISINIS